MELRTERRRSFWGWGYEDQAPSGSERDALAAMITARFGVTEATSGEPPRPEDLDLPDPRLRPPATIRAMCSIDPVDRARHAHGQSFRDVLRSFRGRFPHPPDLVAFPGDEDEVAGLLDWCADRRVAAIPFGGGTSVVGGVEPDVGDHYTGVVSVDLSRLDAVPEVDETSRAVRVQGGVLGPALEDALRPHGLSLRHFPQSFEFSTVGGWIATRSAGHHATLATHIEDVVEGLRVITPSGAMQTRRLPASGAGPSPERLVAGSEGVLGIVTEAWLRVQARPRWRSSATVWFDTFERGTGAARALAWSGLHPATCRLLDPNDALIAGSGDGTAAVLLVAFESADHPLEPWLARALECCADVGGMVDAASVRHRDEEGVVDAGESRGVAETWRRSFLRAPYLRDALVAMGMIVETFETAVTWDRFEALHSGVMAAVDAGLRDAGIDGGAVSCRLTHVYPDGAAPYYTVVAAGRRDAEEEQWAIVKLAASEAIERLGGTTTHHHAVGRDHRPWYDRERPDIFAEALRAAKATLDPAGIMNPGVLLEPRMRPSNPG
jgi:alkyldihydroxyacetonephosphate synthase